MSDSFNDAQASGSNPSEEPQNKPLKSEADSLSGSSDSADEVSQDTPPTSTSKTDNFSNSPLSGIPTAETTLPSEKGYSTTVTEPLQATISPSEYIPSERLHPQSKAPLAMVETAFLASTASLIWLINYYFPLGPVLRMFFPVPIALVYLRWGNRASWMAALVSGLLLSVLMGPTRSILFFIPYGLMGVQLGALWKRRSSWLLSISIGTLIGTFGFFFRFWLLSILLGEDLWVYVMTQITEVAEWGFLRLGLLAQPSLPLIQAIACVFIIINNAVYLFVVHLVALLMLDRLGNPIPRPPNWVQVLLDYDG
jgi:thiamine transporter ThiT